MNNSKGNNNPDAWEQIEQTSKATVINTEKSIIDLEDSESVSDDYELLDENSDENYDEVLSLTEYTGGSIVPGSEHTDFVVAEYNNIDTVNINKAQEQLAKNFVGKVTKFILEFNDVQLSKDHQSYIKQVGQLQLNELKDMLYLMTINRQMIDNIVARVNMTQAEDYAIINSYNNLINQHIKLTREVQSIYKNIPSVMKKLRADILSNQELEGDSETDEVITEDYGETQFNSSKQLLKSILAKKELANKNHIAISSGASTPSDVIDVIYNKLISL